MIDNCHKPAAGAALPEGPAALPEAAQPCTCCTHTAVEAKTAAV